MRPSPSERVVLSCLGPATGETGRADVRDCAAALGVRWDSVVEMAAWHRVSGMVLSTLRDSGAAPLVPADAERRLEASYTETLARNLRALDELDRVCGELERAAIDVARLKGAALLRSVYEDPGLRPMVDLDLLVRRHQVPAAGATLGDLGYRPAPPFAGAAKREWLWSEHARWPPLVSPDGMVVVEIHHRLGHRTSPLGFDVDGLWSRARTDVEGRGRRPAAEDLLVHVALHCLLDRRLRSEGALGQLHDVARLVGGAAGAIDWDIVVSEARAHRFGPPLATVLELVKVVLGAAVPKSVITALDPEGGDPELVAELVSRRVLRRPPWVALERLALRTTVLRQLLPPRPARVWARAGAPDRRGSLCNAYASWVTALAGAIGRRGELRRELELDRAFRRLVGPSGLLPP